MYEYQQLQEFVPHRPPMFLLERMIACDTDDSWLISEVEIRESSTFFDNARAGVPIWIGFEYMAQSIAALSGIAAKANHGRDPRIGFIMGVREYECSHQIFPLGSILRVEVRQVFKDAAVVSFQCTISVNGEQYVTSIVNAIEPDTDEFLMKMGVISA